MHIFGGVQQNQANKTTLKQQLNDEEKEEKNEEKWDGEPRHLSVLGWAMLFSSN